MTHQSLRVDLAERSYDILIGTDLIADAGTHILPHLKRPRVAIITDENVAAAHLAAFTTALGDAGIESVSKTLPAGETSKSWAHLQDVVEWLLEVEVARDDMVIALGGGVIGDLVGFAAAILRRGVQFVQVPTSLLAQVDSSVGGKTAINSPHGKNLIGAFHQPCLVLADICVLETLTDRDFRAGMGEVVKYGLLGDEKFFERLEKTGTSIIAGDRDARIAAVLRSCEMKADIVARDEKEHGDRALLNLGHTFCHALEAATGYSDRLLHGEGVAIGCTLAFDLSAKLGLCSQEDPSRVRALLADLGMRWRLEDIPGDLPDAKTMVRLMHQDKKVKEGKIGFILARGIGDAFQTSDVPLEKVEEVLSL